LKSGERKRDPGKAGKPGGGAPSKKKGNLGVSTNGREGQTHQIFLENYLSSQRIPKGENENWFSKKGWLPALTCQGRPYRKEDAQPENEEKIFLGSDP